MQKSFWLLRSHVRVSCGLMLLLATLAGCSADRAAKQAAPSPAQPVVPVASDKPGALTVSTYHLPTEEEIARAPDAASVHRGLEIVTHTYETLPEHVGNGLHCTSCHLEGGTKANAAPWLGILAVYPKYRARSGKQASIEDRINDCFERSLNGKPLPNDSADMSAVVSYMRFISRDVPAGQTPGSGLMRIDPKPVPDRDHGAQLYTQRCALCHAADGTGQSPNGIYAFPPLAGPRSYNIAAGMARLNTAAAFIRANMPLGQGGSLTDQEAYDLADYVIHLDRPDFPGKEHDWPKGGKPADARY